MSLSAESHGVDVPEIIQITNLGAVNIRLRSLFAALDERDEVAAEKAE